MRQFDHFKAFFILPFLIQDPSLRIWLSQHFLAPPSGRPRNRHFWVHLAPTSPTRVVSLPLSTHAEQLRLFHVTMLPTPSLDAET